MDGNSLLPQRVNQRGDAATDYYNSATLAQFNQIFMIPQPLCNMAQVT